MNPLTSFVKNSNTEVPVTALACFNMLPVNSETLEQRTTPETNHARPSAFGNKATASYMFEACVSNSGAKGAALRLRGAVMTYHTYFSPQITSKAR